MIHVISSSRAFEDKLLTKLTALKESALVSRERALKEEKASFGRRIRREQQEQVRGLHTLPIKQLPVQEGERPRKVIGSRLNAVSQSDDVPMEIDRTEADRGSRAPARRNTLSVAEQRARAKAWAEEEAAKVKGATTKAETTPKSKSRSGPRKSISVAEAVEQARKEEEDRAEAAARNCLSDASNAINSDRRKSIRKGK